ncbi:hypothetical protein L7F22_012959 [Adiantum nelumboides]|nr:hypothetical protein [Adiantum nelumboides]
MPLMHRQWQYRLTCKSTKTSACSRKYEDGDDHLQAHTTLSTFSGQGCISSLLARRGSKCLATQAAAAYMIILATLSIVALERTVMTCDGAVAETTYNGFPALVAHSRYSIGGDGQFHEIERVGAAAAREEGGGQQELLAVRHDRRDPLQHFKQYKGGHNLQSKHYLASTLFTGIHGYFLGTIWLLAGVLIGAFVVYLKLHRRSHKEAFKKQRSIRLSTSIVRHSKLKFVPAMLSTILVALIISCCGLACVESQNFHTSAKKVERTLIEEGANNATRMIENVTRVMGQMKLDIEHYDGRIAERLDNTSIRLNKASISLAETVHNHKRSLDSALIGLNVGVLVLATTNIILWSFGLACFSITSKLRWPFFVTLSLLWILTSINWLAFGFTYSICNFSSDTCEALEEYKNSSKNTTLDNILPCHDLAAGSGMVHMLRARIFEYIERENKKIANLTSKHGRDKRLNVDMVEDLSTTHMRLCNPFLGPPMYLARADCNNALSIYKLPQLLSLFKCASKDASTKKGGKPCISPRHYNATVAYISAIEKFVGMLPEVQNLTSCSFVENTFSVLLQSRCGPLQRSIKAVWLAMLLLSTLSTLTIFLWLLQFWIIRKYSHLFVHWGGTITPHNHTHLSP